MIEDCAQSYLATAGGKTVGTWGDIGCFSLQQGKHITTGEGGFVATNDDALARRVFLFVNKAWGYGDAQPDHYFLALNYRITELQGAVGLAQLKKLDRCVESRVATAEALTAQLHDIPGITPPVIAPDATHIYWKYIVDGRPRGRHGRLGRARCEAQGTRDRKRAALHPKARLPVRRLPRPEDVRKEPVAVHAGAIRRPSTTIRRVSPARSRRLERVLVLPWNERYTDEHVEFIATSLRDAVAELTS